MPLYSFYEMPTSLGLTPQFLPWEWRTSAPESYAAGRQRSEIEENPMFYLMSNTMLPIRRNRGTVAHQLNSQCGLHQSAPNCYSCQKLGEQKFRESEDPTERQWIKVLHIGEFGPDDVSVKAVDEQNKILVEGKKSVHNQGEVVETVELKRELTVPKDVSLNELKVFFRNDRTVVMIAPLKSAKKTTSASDNVNEAGEEKNLDVEVEVEVNSTNGDCFIKDNKPGSGDNDNEPDGELCEGTNCIVDRKEERDSLGENGALSSVGSKAENKDLATKEGFQLSVDLSGFAPKNVEVRRRGNTLTLRANQNQQHGDWCSSHQVIKLVQLPDDVKPETLKCKLGQDGKLAIEAERKEKANC